MENHLTAAIVSNDVMFQQQVRMRLCWLCGVSNPPKR